MEVKEIFEEVIKQSDKEILSGERNKLQCILIQGGEYKKHNIQITPKTEAAIIAKIKDTVIVHGLNGYIIQLDTQTTKKNIRTQDSIKGYCKFLTLYTPTERISEYVWYSGTEILGRERIEGRNNIFDRWDRWSTGLINIEKKIDLIQEMTKKLDKR